jgi:TrmH family RNA methyltransferase
MLTANELKYYSSLLKKKCRSIENKFIVEGKRFVDEGLKSEHNCEVIIHTSKFKLSGLNNYDIIRLKDIRVEQVKSSEFKKLSDTKTPQNIVAVFHKKKYSAENKINRLIVALENISDPGNLGTILRTCDWFGISHIIISGTSADLYNPKVLRSSMGSIFHVNALCPDDFYRELSELKAAGYAIVCADLGGTNIYNYSPGKKTAIVFCSEASGPSDNLRSLAVERVTIPKLGEAESLNVASASAVILSQLTKVYHGIVK